MSEKSPVMQPRRLKKGVRVAGQVVLLVLGVGAFVLALKGFIQPNNLLAGGVGGASLLIERFSGLPVGLVFLVLNVPIFVLGVRFLGRRFALFSALAVVMTWMLADWLPFPRLTDDPMLAGIFGGALSGIGTALALKAGGSLGGFDTIGVIVNRRFAVGIGEVLLVLNGALVVASGLVDSPEVAMYTLIGIFSTRWTIDSLTSSRPRKAFLVMSKSPGVISDRVLRQMGRGLTVLPAHGGWTGEELSALLCVVTQPETRELADIVRDEDPEAFVVVLEASEVVGRFRTPSAMAYWRKLKESPRPAS